MPLLLAKPCQSGKTFSLLKRTTKLIERNKKSVHIIITDNSLIQLDQLDDRIKSVTGEDTIVLSSTSDDTIRSVMDDLCNFRKKYILFGANMTQFNKVDKIIRRMFDTRVAKCIGRAFYIWVDEGDKIAEPENVKLLDKWSNYDNVRQICYITATPHSLIVRYGRLAVVKVELIYNKKTYNKWSDCKIITMKPTEDPKLFIKRSFNIREPQPGQVWFIAPGSLCDTHDETTRFLNRRNFYVLTINSEGEILTTPIGKKIKMEGRHSLSERINAIYHQYDLKNEIFAIVGYNRIGRGITIQSDGMFITHAIFPTVPGTKAALYQLAGRLAGNYKQYRSFKSPIVFCTEYFDKVAYEMEDIVINIAKLSSVNDKKYKEIQERAEKKFRRSL